MQNIKSLKNTDTHALVPITWCSNVESSLIRLPINFKYFLLKENKNMRGKNLFHLYDIGVPLFSMILWSSSLYEFKVVFLPFLPPYDSCHQTIQIGFSVETVGESLLKTICNRQVLVAFCPTKFIQNQNKMQHKKINNKVHIGLLYLK